MNPTLEQIFQMLSSLTVDELLHLRDEIDDYLEGSDSGGNDAGLTPAPKDASGRYIMPRMRQLYDWGAIRDGDRLHVIGHESQPAILVGYKEVEYQGNRMSIHAWAKEVAGWRSINVYLNVILEREDRPLWEARRDAMIANGLEYPG